jgi:hypothetical protein
MTRTSADARAPVATRGAWAALAVIAGGLFLAVMSTTVVSVALPTIGRHVHANATDLEWIVDAYVAYASLLDTGGDRRPPQSQRLVHAWHAALNLWAAHQPALVSPGQPQT